MSGTRAGSLLGAVDRTVTGAGARLLAQDLSAPLMDQPAIEARLGLVQLFHDDAMLRDQLRVALRALPDIGRALGRLAMGRGRDRKSTRLNPVTNAQIVCRLLLEQKNKTNEEQYKKN